MLRSVSTGCDNAALTTDMPKDLPDISIGVMFVYAFQRPITAMVKGTKNRSFGTKFAHYLIVLNAPSVSAAKVAQLIPSISAFSAFSLPPRQKSSSARMTLEI